MEAYIFSRKRYFCKNLASCYQVLDAHIFALKVLYVNVDARQTHKWKHIYHSCVKALGTVFRHFAQAHLLTTLKKNSNGAIDSTKWRLNLDKFRNSNTFLAVIGRL